MTRKRDAVRVIGGKKRMWKFRLAGSDEVHELPLLGALPVSVARKMSGLSSATAAEQVDAAIDLFESLCPGVVETLTMDQLTELVAAWREASGISVGESPASPA